MQGSALRLGRGCAGEPYEAIGRGQLNIEGLPVWRDAAGGIGTPTSDNDRTKMSETTSRLLMTVNIYGPSEMDSEAFEALLERLLTAYAGAREITTHSYSPVP